MNFVSVVILTCTLLVGTSLGTKAGQPPTPTCRPGFSESFYTVFVSRDLLRGQSILKGWRTSHPDTRTSHPDTLLSSG
ncbi:cadherin-4-like [Salvelinus sp. IW2-2015]|uniref:cadherin-4-like n=1 Tax=Salvelinus sp. IW2-2015 TaxID=2691554 RepID=UPI000CDF96F3|nr:cadherin-4-like [Salvelinus alpinus]